MELPSDRTALERKEHPSETERDLLRRRCATLEARTAALEDRVSSILADLRDVGAIISGRN